jgi:hypothetical protein
MRERKKLPTSLQQKKGSLYERADLLAGEMLDCCDNNRTINLSLPPHHETAEALHRVVYKDGVPNILSFLKVSYNDGTSGGDFPIRLLWKPPPNGWNWQPKEHLHLQVGTLSFRHVEYDRFVDCYLIRDKETRHLSQSEIEKLAHQRMKEFLDAPQFQSVFYLTIYQAGLEPLAVGIYRALTEYMVVRIRQNSDIFRVRPIYVANESGEFSGREPLSIWGIGLNENA